MAVRKLRRRASHLSSWQHVCSRTASCCSSSHSRGRQSLDVVVPVVAAGGGVVGAVGEGEQQVGGVQAAGVGAEGVVVASDGCVPVVCLVPWPLA